MAQAIAKAKRPAMVLLTESLMEIVRPYQEVWQAPSSIPETVMEEAIEQLEIVGKLMEPAPVDIVQKWLNSLGLLVAGKMSADEAKVRISAYAYLLDLPGYAYDKENLRKAAIEFKWWPSFGELHEFLKRQDNEISRTYWRLKLIQRFCRTDEAIAAEKAAEDAAKLARMLSTPAGRIRHRHHERFWRPPPGVRASNWGWWNLVDDLLAQHPEEIVDAWHTEVAALDWDAQDFNTLAELRSRSRARLDALDAAAISQRKAADGERE